MMWFKRLRALFPRLDKKIIKIPQFAPETRINGRTRQITRFHHSADRVRVFVDDFRYSPYIAIPAAVLGKLVTLGIFKISAWHIVISRASK